MNLSHEKSRCYFWVANSPPPQNMLFEYPKKLIEENDGTHKVTDSRGDVYWLRNWDVCKVELKGVSNEEDQQKLIVSG